MRVDVCEWGAKHNRRRPLRIIRGPRRLRCWWGGGVFAHPPNVRSAAGRRARSAYLVRRYGAHPEAVKSGWNSSTAVGR